MSDKKLHKMTVILTIGMLIAYLLDSRVLEGIVGMITFGMIAFLYKDVWKQLSIWRILGVIFFFFGIVSIVAFIFYYIANPIIKLISIGWLNTIVTYAVIIATLILALIILYKGLLKITGGKFSIETENEAENIVYPINEEVKQLIDDGKEIQAIKLTRKLYGYSLLEAKKYVNSLH